MLSLVVAAFLLVHGLIHLAVWLPQPNTAATSGQAGPPFDPHHSWLLSTKSPDISGRGPAVACAVLYAISALAVAMQIEASATVWVIAAAGLGLILKIVYFNPWLLFGIALDAGILVVALSEWPESVL